MQQSVNGASHVPPVVVGNAVLFVQEKGSVVRDLTYKLEVDGYGNDLSVLANHLFAGHAIVEWAYAQVPHSIVWCMRDNRQRLHSALDYLSPEEYELNLPRVRRAVPPAALSVTETCP